VNLLFLIGRFPPGAMGGAEVQAEGWAKRLASRHRVTVISREEPGQPPGTLVRDGFTLVRLARSSFPLWRAARDVNAIERTVRALAPRPDVTLCFQTLISGFAGIRLRRRFGIPTLVWIRGEGEFRAHANPLVSWMRPQVWREADVILLQTPGNRRNFLDAVRGADPALAAAFEPKTRVIGNGLELPPRPSPAPPQGAVLSVGRLIHDKGMDVLIDALAGSTRTLVIAGDGVERGALERRARERGVAARFEGFVSRERLATLYRECSCVVLASRRGEGLPNAVIEAMAHERPVVATDVNGSREVIADGENGLLVAPEDAASLHTALDRLAASPEMSRQLAERGRASVEAMSWERLVPSLDAMLSRWAS
jgi:glycosyltransferase involved in cell wall biosynthesis